MNSEHIHRDITDPTKKFKEDLFPKYGNEKGKEVSIEKPVRVKPDFEMTEYTTKKLNYNQQITEV